MKVLCKGGVPFLSKEIYRKVRSWSSRRSFTRQNFAAEFLLPRRAQMFSIPDYRHSQKNLLSVYPKKHFSLFKSVTGDHLGFKCKNNYGKRMKGSTTRGSYESRLFKGASQKLTGKFLPLQMLPLPVYPGLHVQL